jgi:hypothetical protein
MDSGTCCTYSLRMAIRWGLALSFGVGPLTAAPFATHCAADRSARIQCLEAEKVLLNQRVPV